MHKADTGHLDAKTPKAIKRRVSVIPKEELINPDFETKGRRGSKKPAEDVKNAPPAPGIPVGTFRKNSGNIEFP
jgi:hypothetical protein